MIDCQLIQENDYWYCPVCDEEKQRILPVKALRNCGVITKPKAKPCGCQDRNNILKRRREALNKIKEKI